MDVIASVAFGTQVDSQKDPDDPFVYHAQKFFSFAFFRPIMFVFIAFPFLAPLARVIPNKRRDEMNNFFINCIQKIIRQRDEQPVEEDSPYYSNVQDLKYLDMVISEALRLYPPGFRFARDVDEDCVVNGQFLPKGATLEIPAGDLHYDPEYWPEPEKFIPDRFPAEAKASRHPFVYLPFGAGPRSCVGMRLAQLEIKMALVHVFRKFNIVASTDTKVPLELKSHSTLGPKNGIYVKITKRGTEGEPVTPPAEEE